MSLICKMFHSNDFTTTNSSFKHRSIEFEVYVRNATLYQSEYHFSWCFDFTEFNGTALEKIYGISNIEFYSFKIHFKNPMMLAANQRKFYWIFTIQLKFGALEICGCAGDMKYTSTLETIFEEISGF